MRILVVPQLDWVAALQNRVHKIFQRLTSNHQIHVVYFEHENKGINKSYRLKNRIILHKPPTIQIRNMLLFYILNGLPIYSYINKIIRMYEIEIIVSTNFLFAPFVIRAAHKNKIPFIFDFVDFQPYHINYINFLPSILNKIGSFSLTALLNHDIKQSDYTITTGIPLQRYANRIKTENTSIVSNGVDESIFNNTYDGTIIQKKYNLTSPIVCFIGALEYWIDYDSFFQSISMLRESYPTINCLLIGPSRHYGLDKVKQLATKYGLLNHIIFTGLIPYREIPFYICASDICILPFASNYLTHCIIPMKLFEYLACERPVISVPLAGVKSIAKNTIFYAKKPEELRNRIQFILSNQEKTNKKIELGRELVKKYSWKELSKEYESILERICVNFKRNQ